MDKKISKIHSAPVEEVLETLDSGMDGLSSEKAKERLERYGKNRLPGARKKNPFLRFLSHFNDVLIYVLL
ncbi:MAG: cation-transporting P-type ATPase, partial [Thermovirgaceae bacterium]